jgi:ribosomal protein S18 acetylase RimI-like enzyme
MAKAECRLATQERSSGMEIRVATPVDLDAVVACADRAFADTTQMANGAGEVANDDLLEQIHERNLHVICGEAHSRIVGYIALLPIADHLFVDSIAVLPEFQGDGLGTQMLVFAEQEASRLGLRSVRLFTKLKDADSFGFYQYRGFTEIGRCDNDGFPRIFFSKDVADKTAAVAASRSN